VRSAAIGALLPARSDEREPRTRAKKKRKKEQAMSRHNTYLDNSCTLIEGQIASALGSGEAMNDNEARYEGKRHWEFRIHFRSLLRVVDASPGRAWAIGSTTDTNASVWEQIAAAGFHVHTVDRRPGCKEKQVDVMLIMKVIETTADFGPGDVVTLITGDGDFVPLVEFLRKRGITVRIRFWRHATSRALIAAASEFHPLDLALNAIRLTRRVA
jgi:uncharacterized LabA/DUF88 family protein